MMQKQNGRFTEIIFKQNDDFIDRFILKKT